MDELLRHIHDEKHREYFKAILEFYVPIALELPQLRDNAVMMTEEVKAVSDTGTTDIATMADKRTEERIKKQVDLLGYNWQFWGEEGDYSDELDTTKSHTLIVDPIEGTNNFKARNDDNWGSVLALIDNTTRQPIMGIVAHPTKNQFYVGVKDSGAYVLTFDSNSVLKQFEPMSQEPLYEEFTFNASPHFSDRLLYQVERFLAYADDTPTSFDNKFPERKKLSIEYKGRHAQFINLEGGALELVTHRGTVYFKTSNEMAAVFVILGELGGVVTDAEGNSWHMGINTLICARSKQDYDFLKDLYKESAR